MCQAEGTVRREVCGGISQWQGPGRGGPAAGEEAGEIGRDRLRGQSSLEALVALHLPRLSELPLYRWEN